MLELTSKQRKILEKAAHNLDPIVIIGQNGVTDSLVQMVSNSLKAHELIKVKFNEYIALKTDSTLVRIIGNVAIFYKENEDSSKRKIKLKQAAK